MAVLAKRPVILAAALVATGMAGACTHRVQVDPIEITLNVNITQEVRVRLQPEIDELIDDNPELF